MYKITTKWICCGKALWEKVEIGNIDRLNHLLDNPHLYTDITWKKL